MTRINIRFITLVCLLLTSKVYSQGVKVDPSSLKPVENTTVKNKYFYTYIDRPHTMKENFTHIGGIYLASWAIYPLSQPEVFREKGSFTKYKANFGKLVFDKDEPFWNWFVHPISGSQLFLYYRANGYNRVDSVAMVFISSALFEFTIEIYTEPASVQDLYQTPILGSLMGVGLEKASMYLLNSGSTFGKVLGHILNPSTLFWFYEGKLKLAPYYDGNRTGMNMYMDF